MPILPRHIGIIMDGNGRWATARRMSRLEGHRLGARTLDNVVKWSRKAGIDCLSVYAFSTENWKRPREEVDHLMSLFSLYLRRKISKLRANQIHVVVSGDRQALPQTLRDLIASGEQSTAQNARMTLNICFNYGGREDIAQAVRRCIAHNREAGLPPAAITEDMIAGYLYNSGIPPLDLIIRTSGEQRLSNFMMWQAADAEFFVTRTNWPEFSRAEFEAALKNYADRATARQLAEADCEFDFMPAPSVA